MRIERGSNIWIGWKHLERTDHRVGNLFCLRLTRLPPKENALMESRKITMVLPENSH